jgi:hypothetical protein
MKAIRARPGYEDITSQYQPDTAIYGGDLK